MGTVVDPSIKEIPRKLQFCRVNKKMNNIFKSVIMLDIPVLRCLKMRERLSLFNSCMLQKYPFNRTVFRKG